VTWGGTESSFRGGPTHLFQLTCLVPHVVGFRRALVHIKDPNKAIWTRLSWGWWRAGLVTCGSRRKRETVAASDQDQIAFCRSLICTGARRNLATCSTYRGNRNGRFEPTMDLAGKIFQSGTKSSFSIDLTCTTLRRIPASASTNPGSKNGDLVLVSQEKRTRAPPNHHLPSSHSTRCAHQRPNLTSKHL